jgi:hypothetical protein
VLLKGLKCGTFLLFEFFYNVSLMVGLLFCKGMGGREAGLF